VKVAAGSAGIDAGQLLRMRPAAGAMYLFDAHGRHVANV
jgi:hypothetical protein